MDGGNGVPASTRAWRADRAAVHVWLLLLAITAVSVISSVYAQDANYEPVIVVACAGIKFWFIAHKFMNSRGSALWLRAALDIYVVVLVVGLTIPYLV